jgi:hypothetical protein
MNTIRHLFRHLLVDHTNIAMWSILSAPIFILVGSYIGAKLFHSLSGAMLSMLAGYLISALSQVVLYGIYYRVSLSDQEARLLIIVLTSWLVAVAVWLIVGWRARQDISHVDSVARALITLVLSTPVANTAWVLPAHFAKRRLDLPRY